jgi:hypothetical protein
MIVRPRAFVSLLLLALLSVAGGAGSTALRGPAHASIRAADDQQLSVAHAAPRVLVGAERQRRTADSGSLPAALPVLRHDAPALGIAAAPSWPRAALDLRDTELRFTHDATAPPGPRD